MGAAAVSLGCLGSAYGTAKSSIGISAMGVIKPDLIMRGIIPVVMAGIVGIYGLIVAIIISTSIDLATGYPLAFGFFDLGAGIAVGLARPHSYLCRGAGSVRPHCRHRPDRRQAGFVRQHVSYLINRTIFSFLCLSLTVPA